jgi:uncharacterized membrane protein
MTSDDDARREREQRVANRIVWRRARDVRREFDKILTRLWIGNGGGAVATINYIGKTHQKYTISLLFFLVGLVILSAMDILYLLRERKALHGNQYSAPIISFKMGFFESPKERAGFTLRVILPSVAAAACFGGGCIAGLIALI